MVYYVINLFALLSDFLIKLVSKSCNPYTRTYDVCELWATPQPHNNDIKRIGIVTQCTIGEIDAVTP